VTDIARNHDESGQFVPGNKRGRPPGSPNKIGQELREALLQSAENIGEMLMRLENANFDGLSKSEQVKTYNRLRKTGSRGAVRTFEELYHTERAAYASLLGRTIPREHKVDVDGEIAITQGDAKRRLRGILEHRPDVLAKIIDITPFSPPALAAVSSSGGRAGRAVTSTRR
jgi:hypothetical protein